ncbi:MAG: hypothetical protein ACO1RA_20035 [Planctomycetaceae bacterium]
MIVSWSVRTLRIISAACLCIFAFTQIAAAEESTSGPKISQVNIGLGKVIRSGYWTKIKFQVSPGAENAQVFVVTQDGDRALVRYPATQAAAASENAAFSYESLVKVGPENSTWQILIERAGGESSLVDISALVSTPLGAKREWWVTLGSNVGLEEARNLGRRPEELAIACSNVSNAEELPTNPLGYDGVDYIALSLGSNSVWQNANPTQKDALLSWVRQGGRLVLCLSGSADHLAGSKQFVSQVLPGIQITPEPLQDAAGLDTYTSEPFSLAASVNERPLVCVLSRIADSNPSATVPPSPPNASLEELVGKVELAEGGTAESIPLLVRQAVGLGQVILVTVDLAEPAFAEWEGRPRLLATLLSAIDTNSAADKSGRRNSGRLGYDDLSGQLRVALDHFPSVWPINFTAASLFTLAYLLLIGPIDYLLLSKTGIARHWTWFTFPAILLGISGGAWWISQRAHGEQLQVNQVTLIDIDHSQHVTRGSYWGALYSPSSQRLRLELEQGKLDWLKAEAPPQQVLNWQGLPGTGLGGLASKQVAFGQGAASVVENDLKQDSGISDLAMHAASSKNLSGNWRGTHQLPSPGRLYLDEYGRLMGELASPYPFDLTDCILAQREWLYRVKEWKSGQTLNIADLTPLSLESRLTLQSLTDTKGRITPWQKDSTEIPRILQMIMFHDTVRGTNYTGLSHRYLGQLDLSQHLKLGRAVIIGQAKQPAATLAVSLESLSDSSLEVKTQDLSFYRLVIPVEPQRATAPKAPREAVIKPVVP